MNPVDKTIKNLKRFIVIITALFLLSIGGLYYTGNQNTIFLDDYDDHELTTAFNKHIEFICTDGDDDNHNAYLISKSEGWSLMNKYFKKGDRLIYKRYCSINNDEN